MTAGQRAAGLNRNLVAHLLFNVRPNRLRCPILQALEVILVTLGKVLAVKPKQFRDDLTWEFLGVLIPDMTLDSALQDKVVKIRDAKPNSNAWAADNSQRSFPNQNRYCFCAYA